MGWLKASVELALERPDIGAEFRQLPGGRRPAVMPARAAADRRHDRDRRRWLTSGRVLGGRYQLAGAGRPGRHGHHLPRPDTKLGREVAVKVLRGEYGSDAASWRASSARRRPRRS